jgi:hypothetical protein
MMKFKVTFRDIDIQIARGEKVFAAWFFVCTFNPF